MGNNTTFALNIRHQRGGILPQSCGTARFGWSGLQRREFRDQTFTNRKHQKQQNIISILLFFYVTLNLLDGERGLISYYEKQKIIEQLFQEKKLLTFQLDSIEKKNSLLTDNIDADYLEILYRKKFMVGKVNEKIYTK